MTKFFAVSCLLIAMFVPSGCAAKGQSTVEFERLELRMPNADREAAQRFPSSEARARLQILIGQLRQRSAEEIERLGETAVVHVQPIGPTSDNLLVYAASPQGAVGYVVPGNLNPPTSDSVMACRFEFRVDRLGQPARLGSPLLLAQLMPSADCGDQVTDNEYLSRWKSELAIEGYDIFAQSEPGTRATATVIEQPDYEQGRFDVDSAIDHYLGGGDAVIRTVVLPKFNWQSGVIELVNGESLFYFTNLQPSEYPRAICIVEGVTWDDFANWDGHPNYSSPLEEFCAQRLEAQQAAQLERNRERWRNDPPRIMTAPAERDH